MARGDCGKVHDTRDASHKPSFVNLVDRPAEELKVSPLQYRIWNRCHLEA